MPRIALAVCVALALGGATLLAAPAQAQGKEQVVFSGEADGSLGEVGFWVWCAVDEAGNYDDCNGAIQFDDLPVTKHVGGDECALDGAVRRGHVHLVDGTVG